MNLKRGVSEKIRNLNVFEEESSAATEIWILHTLLYVKRLSDSGGTMPFKCISSYTSR